MLLLYQVYFRHSRWIDLHKQIRQSLHGLIRTCEQTRIPCVLGEVDPHATALAMPIHRQTDVNRVRRVEKFQKNRHFLRIEKVEPVHPDLCAAQKRRVLQLGSKAFHAIGLIGQPSLHTRGEFIHNERDLREFLREPPLFMRTLRRCLTQNIGAQTVAFEFGDGAPQCLGKTALADGTRKDREFFLVLEQDVF